MFYDTVFRFAVGAHTRTRITAESTVKGCHENSALCSHIIISVHVLTESVIWMYSVPKLILVWVRADKRPPQITRHPDSVTIFSFEDLNMTCEASGVPPPRSVSTPTSMQTHNHNGSTALYKIIDTHWTFTAFWHYKPAACDRLKLRFFSE